MGGGLELVAGAVLGVAFQQMYKAFKRAIKFKRIIRRIQSTIQSLTPLINEIDSLNAELGLPSSVITELMVELQKGLELVEKCSEVHWWNCSKKYRYAGKLLEFDESLQRLCQIEMQAAQMREIKELRRMVNRLVREKNLDGHGGVSSINQIKSQIDSKSKSLLEKTKSVNETLEGMYLCETNGVVSQQSGFDLGSCLVPGFKTRVPSFSGNWPTTHSRLE